MRPSDIGREIGTYKRHAPLSDDTFGRVHHKLLRKLQNECRVEPLWNESRSWLRLRNLVLHGGGSPLMDKKDKVSQARER